MRVLKEFGKKAVGHTNEITRYSKPGYSMAHWTYNAKWKGASDWGESVDGDLYNSQVDIRGYLSVESRGGDRYLGVGGFYLNEDTIEFADGYLGSMDVELDPDTLQDELIELMQNTYLMESTGTDSA